MFLSFYQFQDFGLEIRDARSLASIEDCNEGQGVSCQLLLLAHLGQHLQQLAANLRFQLKVGKFK
jgi:hypothetical protein